MNECRIAVNRNRILWVLTSLCSSRSAAANKRNSRILLHRSRWSATMWTSLGSAKLCHVICKTMTVWPRQPAAAVGSRTVLYFAIVFLHIWRLSDFRLSMSFLCLKGAGPVGPNWFGPQVLTIAALAIFWLQSIWGCDTCNLPVAQMNSA